METCFRRTGNAGNLAGTGPRRAAIATTILALTLAGTATAADRANPPSTGCIDEAITPSFEEQRLVNKLPGTDVPAPQRIMEAAGFQDFGPNLIRKLCARDAPTNFEDATGLVKAEGRKLWRAAVDRVQGRHVSGDLPPSDDRMLYWARLTMSKALRQWQPAFAMSDEDRESLLWEFERSSRGQDDIDFPGGNHHVRVIVSGFDPFTLGNPGSTTSTGIRIGNPSGANALSLDGVTIDLPDGKVAAIETYVLPVNYGPFMKGMQEDTLGPSFQSGPKQVDVSITVSQGGGFQFWLEQWNGRFHGPSAGNDGIALCPSAGGQRIPPNDDCDIYPPQRWLGYDPKPWQMDKPAQFTLTSLPVASMIAADTGADVPPPPGAPTPQPYTVIWHTNYTVFPDCFATPTQSFNTPVEQFPPPTPPIPPAVTACARQGGGGDYLSNESAYRNTLLRDTFKLKIPAGHIHVPVMTRFGDGAGNNQNPSAITDPTFEAYRDTIVEQTHRLILQAVIHRGEGAPYP
ncbi:MAG: hypothetical protein J2P50_11075 [Hyphomicrobiaceae bacterium]|nr:hypothetical protein [Hyphomicrobiaceae bacterium]